jgi:hypothetical protein
MNLFQFSYVLLWLLALVLALASVVLLYLLAQLQARVARTGTGYGAKFIGRQLPFSSAKDVHTSVTTRVPVFDHRPHVVLLLSPNCGTCRSLLDEITAATDGDVAGLPLLLLCMGSFDACKSAVAKIHSVPVLVLDVRNDETSDLWLAGFPAAFILDDTGVVIDVRHPLSLQGVMAAIGDAKWSGAAHAGFEHERQRAREFTVGARGA